MKQLNISEIPMQKIIGVMNQMDPELKFDFSIKKRI
jgi:hypothetical protein